MATAPLDIYETTPAQELYETSPAQEIVIRAAGMHFLPRAELSRAGFVAQWDSLVEDASEPNPFFEPWYLLPSLAALDPHEEVSVAAFYARGRLVGLLPLALAADYYRYPLPHAAAWLHANSFCGAPLIAKGWERQFWQALLAAFDRDPCGAMFLHLPQLPSESVVVEALRAILTEEGRAGGTVRVEERALLSSDLSAENYFAAAMPNKKRKELRRQAKRLGEEGELEFARQIDARDITEWTAEFLVLEQAGWKGGEGSALADGDATCALFRDAIAGAADAGRLERLTLRLDGKPIAMLANFIAAPGAFSFKTAFDERYSRYSPGVLLQKENLALLDRTDIDWCDSCAAEGHPMIERIWRDKRRMISLNVAIGGSVRRSIFRQLLRIETRDKAIR
ncbi:GNAT family N-acetyltransferase [Altererythrobacter arenosus]|uniref:GNAT family N-acetyltransferase n=1 Tax=Altererythrobacter arenosus TaxID=3032592 RepID=A0ABY8FS05_9SPHN|nr:GNAT family N-acetyltransferase [Altererythrobacter sp. CAU 1644]WFL77627.1 GNAT family N-acetyltransferase [Altererythrobacter sp. CAU 1644]